MDSQLILQVALCLDTILPERGLPTVPAAAGVQHQPRKRADPDLAAALIAETGRLGEAATEAATEIGTETETEADITRAGRRQTETV